MELLHERPDVEEGHHADAGGDGAAREIHERTTVGVHGHPDLGGGRAGQRGHQGQAEGGDRPLAGLDPGRHGTHDAISVGIGDGVADLRVRGERRHRRRGWDDGDQD